MEQNFFKNRFSWVAEDKLGGSSKPGIYGSTGDDIRFLADQGVTLLVSLTSKAPDLPLLKTYGIRSLHYPVKDFTAPGMEQLYDFCIRAGEEISAAGSVVVHCYAGKGRTGTFLAAYLVFKGEDAGNAIKKIRKLRPGSIETVEQEDAVADFRKYLVKRKI